MQGSWPCFLGREDKKMNTSIRWTAMAGMLAMTTVPSLGQEQLNIGAMSALSGPGSAWGKAFLRGAEMAFDDANQNGGLDVGGKKYKINVIPYDTKYQVSEALPAANRLIFG